MLTRATVRTFMLTMTLAYVGVALGQIPTGRLNGLVSDQGNAVVVGARVTAVSTNQEVIQEFGKVAQVSRASLGHSLSCGFATFA